MQDQQADAKKSSNDELRDKLREGTRAKVQERLKEAVQSRKRVVGEKVRFQPKRNVKTRSEYRKEIIEGSNSFQQEMRCKITGTQLF